MKPTLAYLNVATLAETDVTILGYLTREFNVHWFVIYEPNKDSSLNIETIKKFAENNGIILHVHTRTFRIRSLKNWAYYYHLYKAVLRIKPSLIYHCNTEPYWACFFLFDRKSKVIMGLHDVDPHSSRRGIGSNVKRMFNSFVRRIFPHHVVFSKNQKDLYEKMYGKEVENLGMSCKDFGHPTVVTPDIREGVKLLFFGTISHYKGLDLLIKALESIISSGVSNIYLTIAGKGNDKEWNEFYLPLIKSKDHYNIQYRYLGSDEIPNLVAGHHFMILPYRDATQSGPVLIAANYCMPLIAPNYGCFADTFDKYSAILYPPGELKQALLKVSKITPSGYEAMKTSCKKVKENNSEEAVAENFIHYFKNFLDD